MISYPIKENPIGSAVGKILRYRHTERQTYILLLYYKDKETHTKSKLKVSFYEICQELFEKKRFNVFMLAYECHVFLLWKGGC